MTEDTTLQRAGRAGGWAAALAMMVLLAEVIWMVLPFVGYVSLHVTMDPFFRFRRRWFQPFFMRSYHLAGAPLALLGLGFFLSGAAQIYGRKLRGGGAVTGGLYRWVRHPQYSALGVLGLGLLLLWPRYYLLLAFVTMGFLYFALARAEERLMLRIHGEGYRSYLLSTSAFFPGDRHVMRLGPPPPASFAGVLRGAGTWTLALVVAFAGALGVSAATIMNRPIPTVETEGIVGIDRIVYHRDAASSEEIVREIFGREALERSLRQKMKTRETLVEALRLLSEDHDVRLARSGVPPPATLLALPWDPRRQLVEDEPPCSHADYQLLRVYLVAASGKDNEALAPSRAFDGYLKGKTVKLILSTLVDVKAGEVLDVTNVTRSRRFVSMWDRALDKESF